MLDHSYIAVKQQSKLTVRDVRAFRKDYVAVTNT
jgi:hypothetical protein